MSDTSILQQVAVSMMNFGAPMLLDEKDWNDAERMASSGLLQRHDPVFGSYGYTLTDTGIEAYQQAFPPEPPSPPVKAWGNHPPKTLRGRISFIKRQCVKPLEKAYWLEVEDESGSIKSMTLSSTAVDKKLDELNYDRWNNDGRIYYGEEDTYALYTCDVTGELLSGCWTASPDAIAYELDGFAWRRHERFQMEERDWQEAYELISRLETDDRKQAQLRRLIANSCFIDPISVNNTGLLNPGGGGQNEYEELIALFDFMKESA